MWVGIENYLLLLISAKKSFTKSWKRETERAARERDIRGVLATERKGPIWGKRKRQAERYRSHSAQVQRANTKMSIYICILLALRTATAFCGNICTASDWMSGSWMWCMWQDSAFRHYMAAVKGPPYIAVHKGWRKNSQNQYLHYVPKERKASLIKYSIFRNIYKLIKQNMVVQFEKLNKNTIQLMEYLKSATNVLTICNRFRTSRVLIRTIIYLPDLLIWLLTLY